MGNSAWISVIEVGEEIEMSSLKVATSSHKVVLLPFDERLSQLAT